MSADLLQALKVITQLGVDPVSEDLGVFAVNDVALPIEEPAWDLVLSRVLDDGDDSLEFFGGQFSSTATFSLVCYQEIDCFIEGFCHTAC
jgi:hypothetical protein